MNTDELLEMLKQGDSRQQTAVMSILCHRIEDDFMTTKEKLGSLEKNLVLMFRDYFRHANPHVVDTLLHSKDSNTDINQAYIIGALSAFQLLISQSYAHRADDNFVPDLKASIYSPYLLKEDCSCEELALKTQQSAEQVKKDMRVLESLGAVDFIARSGVYKYFLTPAARTVLENI